MIKISSALTQLMTLGALMVFVGSVAAQQAYPNKSIRFIVPFAPGGSTTIMARLVSQRLTESWGQQVLVDNRGGGNTVIGTRAAATASPDGYTILLVTSSIVTVPLMTSTPYDPLKDFAAVSTLSVSEYTLALHSSVPANDLREFIAYAKARPGQLNYASSGAGGPGHLAGAMFNLLADVKIEHVGYKGASPAAIDLVGGRVASSFVIAINVLNFVKAGKLKIIAVSGKNRMDALPQVPTFAEAGLPGFGMNVWWGVLAPAGTPKEIVNNMSTEIVGLLVKPNIKENLANQGMDPFISTPEQFTTLLKTESAKYAKVIKAANIKLDD